MPHEITTTRPTGETLTARLVQGAAFVGGSISMTESGTVAGWYTGNVPGGTAAGQYSVLIYKASTVVASGTLTWDGTAEVPAAAPTATAVATSVWSASTRTLTAGSSTDPWAVELPGSYEEGTAGHALGKLNAEPLDGPVVVVPGAPAEVGVCRVYAYLETPDNKPAANVEVVFDLVAPGSTDAPLSSGALIWGRRVTVRTNAAGALSDGANPWVELQRTDLLTPAGSKWVVRCARLGITGTEITLTATTANLTALLVPPP